MRLVGFLLAVLLCSPHGAHAADAEKLFDEPAVDRAMSVAIAGRFGPLLGNPYNDDVGLGGTFGFWPARWFGVEVTGQAFVLGGQDNTRTLAVAILRLLDPSQRLESLDLRAPSRSARSSRPFAVGSPRRGPRGSTPRCSWGWGSPSRSTAWRC